MEWLKKGLEGDNQVNRMGINLSQYNFIDWGNKRDEKNSNELWTHNILENLKWWDAHPSDFMGRLKDLPDYEEDCFIVVGASPILRKSVKYLRNLDKRFKIVATNSSIKYLVEHGVVPDYMILIDGKPGKWSLELEGVRDKCKDVVGLFSIAAVPEEVQKWAGKFIPIPYKYDIKKIQKMVEKRYGKDFPVSGGNGFCNAVALFTQFTKATMFLLVGNELSFKKNYYVEGEAQSDGAPYYFATDVHGKEVRTLSPLFEYKIWLENFIVCLAGTHYFCNCSEGILGVESDGTRVPWLDQKSLPDAIREIKDAWDISELPSVEKAKVIYTEFYKEQAYTPHCGRMYWEEQFCEANRKILRPGEFDRVLDFGCGNGDGVQYLRQEGIEAYGVDIAENHALWKDKGVEKYCQSYDGYTIPFEDNYFDMVGCFETFEHIVPEDCERILKEILRVGRNLFVMTIALNVEMCPVGGTFHTHCNIQKPQWWKDLFKKVGFNLIAAECLQYHEMKGEPLMTLFVYASKGETDLYIHTTTEPSNPERRERIRNECGVSRRIVQV